MPTKVFDDKNNFVGTVAKDGIIRDRFNMKKGFVLEDGSLQDTLRIKIGWVEEDGTQRNRFDQRVGFLDAEGKVRSLSGVKVGHVTQIEDTNRKFAGAAAYLLVIVELHKRKTQILRIKELGL